MSSPPSRSSAPTSTRSPLQQLNRGQRLTELLKQPQFQPLPAEKQVAILFAGVNGLLDDVEVKDLRAFEDGYYPYLESAQPAILTDIATKKALDDDIKGRLTAANQGLQGQLPCRPEG